VQAFLLHNVYYKTQVVSMESDLRMSSQTSRGYLKVASNTNTWSLKILNTVRYL
jgi:hypothetical protein